MNSWKRIVWWVVLILGLGGAYTVGAQMNARWYRQPQTLLDASTYIEVIGDALSDECYAVLVVRNGMNVPVAATTLGKVRCR